MSNQEIPGKLMTMAVERLDDDALTARRDAAYTAGDWPLFERCEDELDRREGEEPHEDSPALDPPWWEYR